MIPKRLVDIVADDIEALVANTVCESTTLEFKRDLPGTSDEAKREFLADISGLANTAGGDLLFGIAEQDGCAETIIGIPAGDMDAEILRLNNILSTGLEPRVRHSTALFTCAIGRVLLIRVDRSWNGPHRVTFRGHDKFYGRTSAGKYALDVQQLRRAFIDSATIAERLRGFRTERIAAVIGGETPIPMVAGPKFIIHALPFESFLNDLNHDLVGLPFDSFQPLNANRGWRSRITFEGRMVLEDQNGETYSYTHVYNSGLIEMVESRLLGRTFDDGARLIPSEGLGNLVIDGARKSLALLRAIGVNAPAAIAVTLTDVKGGRLALDWHRNINHSPILNEHLFLPEAVFQNLESRVDIEMRRVIDRVWNACGVEQCPFFDENGHWAPSR